MVRTAGVGFKPMHFEEAVASPADGLWLEVHAENYMVDGGPRLAMLEAIREARPLSLHGVGISLAGAATPDPVHLERLRRLVARFEPFLVSDHLAWSRWGDKCFPDLLPFPRSSEALDHVVRNLSVVQEALGRPIQVENPALYIQLEGHDYSETDFLAELVRRTGCRLLVDVNNVCVSANNLGFDAKAYLAALPAEAISEIHLAGHSPDPKLGTALLIDSHDCPVSEGVWELFRSLVRRIGPRPTLIERDGNIPSFGSLLAEAATASTILIAEAVPSYA